MSSSSAGEVPSPAASRAAGPARPTDSGLFVPLRNALLDSRQRWRDLVNLAADFAFETDAFGRFSFVMPDPALGWSAMALLGQQAERLLAEPVENGGFNPFATTQPIRRVRTWLKCADGALVCIALAVAPLLDGRGRQIGVRGLGIDVTEQDGTEAQIAAMLRRSEVLDHILTVMRNEVAPSNVVRAALDALAGALGADGVAIIDTDQAGAEPKMTHQVNTRLTRIDPPETDPPRTDKSEPDSPEPGRLEPGRPEPDSLEPDWPEPDRPAPGTSEADRFAAERVGGAQVLATAARLLAGGADIPAQGVTEDGRPVLVSACNTRVGAKAGLVLWRAPGARAWDLDDRLLAGAATLVVRVVLEQEVMQHEMALQARTDTLTGLFNRRAFLEELPRHLDRLDRDERCGTLMYVDLDNFKPVNDQFGHHVGDEVLCAAARMLRNLVRPTDLVARLGGDEFAVWMNGADHMTAAERAEYLRVNAPHALAEIAPGLKMRLSMSIGIASREAGSDENIDSMMRRADLAMYAVKRGGRGHWRVSHKAPA